MTTATKVPSSVQESADWQAINARLQARRGERTRADLALDAAISVSDDDIRKANQISRQAAVDAVAAGDSPKLAVRTIEQQSATVSTLRAERNIIRDAIASLEQQLHKVELAFSRETLDDATEEYRGLCRRVALALVELRDAAADEQRFRESANDGGMKWFSACGLRPMPVAHFATMNGHTNLADCWLFEAKQHGLITESDLP